MKVWAGSLLISIALMILLIFQWMRMDNYTVAGEGQLVDMVSTEKYLEDNHADVIDDPNVKRVKTGIFIQSLKFFNSSEVNFTGYIWQHFPSDVFAGVANKDIEPRFILPEQVQSGSDISPKLSYREKTSDGEVLGWYVEATLRQSFDYARYPFDHKTVWIRLWSKDFSKSVILTPDFDAYEPIKEGSVFGIEETIVLGAWVRENTFFNYMSSSYDTNFGIPNYIGQSHFPELRYNFVIKRRFDNAFIVHLLPLFLVSVLLFAALLTITDCEKTNSLLGFNTSGFLAMCSALFFVVLIAHIQLREQFGGANVVYLEYFYILMYLLLVLCNINTYLYVMRPKRLARFITYRNNLIPKVCFWPFVLISLNLLTLKFL